MNNYFISGTKISLTNSNTVVESIKKYTFSESNYICITGLLELLQSLIDKNFQNAINKSYLNPVHSRLIEFYLRRKGKKNIEPIDPLWLLKLLLKEDLTHFFYGSNNETLKKIKEKIDLEFDGSKIMGYKAAPFIKLDEIENNEILKKDIQFINTLKPDIIWIGIGGWKQDLLMYYYYQNLDKSLLIGVGVVFDLFAGNIKPSPKWIKRIGLRWLYYLIRQPVYRTSKLINLIFLFINFRLKNKLQ